VEFQSLRSLSIPTLTLESLIRRRQQQRIERLAAGPAWSVNDLVFCTAVGAPLDTSNLRRSLDKVAAQAGLGHWTPTELCHSAVSLMSAAGVLIGAISDQVGHETTRTTQSVYRHILNPVQPHALVMDEILAAATPP
jgi:integrase